ncbi:MAG: hypothetical protein RL307_224 [Pseudomonadota bacterium]
MNRWPFMPGNSRHAVGICFEGDGVHWVEVDWPRRQIPRVTSQGVCDRSSLNGRKDWNALWRQSGVRARRTGLALNEQSVIRLRVPLPLGLRQREKWFLLEQSLQAQLPWPLADTAWDCQIGGRPVPGEPGGMDFDDQDGSHAESEWVNVVATPKTELRNSRQWCARAGLRLIRLEPLAQARARAARWQHLWSEMGSDPDFAAMGSDPDFAQRNSGSDPIPTPPSPTPPSSPPTTAMQVALGLALGTVQS